jgi:glutathione S-transferase
MATESAIMLMGVAGSPYTRKMLSLLRYRRIPYRLILGSQRTPSDMPAPKVRLLPTFYFPTPSGELEAVVDSTPIIRRLEKMYSERSTIPTDPAIAFLDYVLEDYGDEWLTKAMFHYRWYYDADIDKAGTILPLYSGVPLKDDQLKRLKGDIAQRQISRLYVVGSNPTTAPIIEDSYRRYLQIMSRHFESERFLFGARPSAADFAAFGQLTQLARFDPTPMEVTTREAPRVSAWVETMEDLSGLEPGDADWLSRDEAAKKLRGLFEEIGRTYVPVMLANAKALASGAADVETIVEGKTWVQKAFPYQGKCIEWMREEFSRLTAADREWVMQLFAGTGCERLLKN